MVTCRDIHQVFGAVPQGGGRLPTEAAKLVGQTLQTSFPEMTVAASRTCAQHLHKASKLHPNKGTHEALSNVATSLGLPLRPFHGPEEMKKAVVENHPLSSFLGSARRLTDHFRKAAGGRKEVGYIGEDLRNAIRRGNPTAAEIQEMKRDLSHAGAREGGAREGGACSCGGWKSTPLDRLHESEGMKAYERRMHAGGLMEGDVFRRNTHATAADRLHESEGMKAYERRMHAGGLMEDPEGGASKKYKKPSEGVGYAEYDEKMALKKHHGKMTKKEKEQAMRDLRKYGVAKPPVKKQSLYDAFR